MSILNDSVESAIESLLNKVVESEAILNPKFEIKEATVKGDGYLGIIKAVKIIGDNKTLSVIVKTAPKNEQLRKITELAEVYSNEIYFYNRIYPTLLNFQLEKDIDRPFTSIAKCFATSKEYLNEGLVLENLRDEGYQLWDRRNPMNPEHLSLILEEYGKFHAISFALKDQNRELYDEISTKVIDLFEKFGDKSENKAAIDFQIEQSFDVLDPVVDEEAIKRLRTFVQNLKEFRERFLFKNVDEYTVITHGDCWCNNMMFKYENNKNLATPNGMRILDWQIVRLGSPILDITHVFYTSAPKEVLDDYKRYMNIYYDSFSTHLRKLGSDPEKVYPFAVFEEHWKRICPNGLFIALFMIKIMMSEIDEVPDFANIKSDSIMEMFSYVPKNIGYKSRLRDTILHFVNNKFI